MEAKLSWSADNAQRPTGWSTDSARRLTVGDKVTVLSASKTGTIVKDDHDSTPYKVKHTENETSRCLPESDVQDVSSKALIQKHDMDLS